MYTLKVALSLLLWSCVGIPYTWPIAYRPPNLQSPPSLPFQIPQYLPKSQTHRPPWIRFRDCVIRFVWKLPIDNQLGQISDIQPSSTPPSSFLARYGGDLVLRFKIQSAEEASALAEAINVLFLDVWEFTAEWVDIRLSKDVLPSLLGLLPTSLQHAHSPLMHDLAQAIFESYPSSPYEEPTPQLHYEYRTFSHNLHTPADQTNIFFRNYQPLSVIIPWMRLLASLFPTHVRMINIGISYEGRDIPALRVGVHPTNSEKPSPPRKTIIIAGGSHAREWISTSSVSFIAYSLITEYGKSQSTTKLVENFDWIFIPTLNPDGYVYTWETDRLWRKNRQQTPLRFCKGIDLDRAYGFEWDGTSKNNPCSESFSGESAFQGVESRRFAAWVRNETEHSHAEIVAFLDFHSYSQQVLYPYSYSCTSAPPSLENLEELAIGLAKAIRLVNGQNYGVTSACEGSVIAETSKGMTKSFATSKRQIWPMLELGGGSALDWFYQEMRTRYAYQIKLRDTGSYGFLLPSRSIVPTGKEALSAVQYLGEFLLGNKGHEVDEVDEEGEMAEKHGAESRDQDVGTEQERKGSEGEATAAMASGENEPKQSPDDGADEGVQWELRRRRRR